MTDPTPTLVERLRYCDEHGLFVAAISDQVASYGEAADALERQASELTQLRAKADALAGAWQPIATAPKDQPILVWYDHDADPYQDPDNPGKLTSYACHAEGGDFLDKQGVTIARWCEAYEESDGWEAGNSWWMPAVWCAWFNGDNAHVVNPVLWQPLPTAPQAWNGEAE